MSNDLKINIPILAYVEKKQKQIVFTFFALFFIIGALIYKDYGMSWDEEMQWKNNGTVVYDYIFHGKIDNLLWGNEKYHGPAFELMLVFVEKILHLKDTRDVYLMRHFMNFFVFFISLIFFYHLCKYCFKNWKLALIGCSFLILSPRIFADAFYNSKDAALLALFIIGMYSLLIFHKQQTYKHAILYALICAFTIDTRIFGLILPLTSFTFFCIEFIYSLIKKTKHNINFKSVGIYVVFLIVFVILFWPLLWTGPWRHFKNAIFEMSRFPWLGTLLYQGKLIYATELPWHYLPVWISITTPIPYLLLFLIGLFFIVKQFITKPLVFIVNEKQYLLVLICFFLPILAIIIMNAVVYDGWRHVFFVYPAFIIIALYGLRFLQLKLKKAKPVFMLITLSILTFTLLLTVNLHPHQYVYFNFLAGKDMTEVKANYELDYYGVSSKQAFDFVLQNDTSSKISICVKNTPQLLYHQLLPKDQRNRIRFVGLEYADYYIDQYRKHPQEYNLENKIFSVMVGNASIMSVFKLTEGDRKRAEVKGRGLMHLYRDFEETDHKLPAEHIFSPSTGAHSGKYVTMVDEINPYSDGFKFTLPDTLFEKKNLVAKLSFWEYQGVGSRTNLVISISDTSNNSYFWNGTYSNSLTGTINKWDKMSATVELPEIRSPSDIINVYLWNNGGKLVYVDDITIDLIERTEEIFKP